MAESVTLTKTAGGNNYYIVEKNSSEVTINEKPFVQGNFTVSSSLGIIKIVQPLGEYPIMVKGYPPEAWTIAAETGYTTLLQVAEAITALANS